MAEAEVPRTRKTAYLGAGLFALAAFFPFAALLICFIVFLPGFSLELSLYEACFAVAWTLSIALAFAVVFRRRWRAPGRPLVPRAVILALTVVLLAYPIFGFLWWLIELLRLMLSEHFIVRDAYRALWQIVFSGSWGLIFGFGLLVGTLPFAITAAVLFQWLEIRHGGDAVYAEAAE